MSVVCTTALAIDIRQTKSTLQELGFEITEAHDLTSAKQIESATELTLIGQQWLSVPLKKVLSEEVYASKETRSDNKVARLQKVESETEPKPKITAIKEPVKLLTTSAELDFDRASVSFPKAGRHDVAIIVANSNYQKFSDIPNISPAYADADLVYQYYRDALGIREGNIIYLKDATQAQMIRLFGSDNDHRGQLFDWVRPSESKVHVYFAGHGAPSVQQETQFLVPVDADPHRLSLNGYSLQQLYANLGKLPNTDVELILEACFSGSSHAGPVTFNASPIYARPLLGQIPQNLTVITAGDPMQLASWEPDGSHSLFTKYFLMGQSGEADLSPYGNRDGKVSREELQSYLKDTVSYFARRHYGREQQVQFIVGGRG